ncbi:MAG: CusA/CzcA family heavy metal efflux RND transporter [Chitinophagaceae bacterium]|nr:CusA/CzcA family heavy metal efflux RND transporter [Chitinophagaceae bacterium]
MLNKIIRFSVKKKLIVGVCVIGLIIAGIINVSKLPIDALPDITSNQVQVITISPSLAAPEVERLVTFQVEQANANIPGIKEMRSISRFGLSVVTIVFSDETDIYWARQQVSERINMVKDEIPQGVGRPELAPVTTGLGEIYQYILRPAKGFEAKYDLTELRSIQDWIVRRQLLGTAGVADVSSFGGYLKQYEVAVDPLRLKSMEVTISDIFSALERNNQNSGGAYIEKGPSSLFIRTEGLTKTTDEIGMIVVRNNPDGIPVFLRDLADVRIGHAVRYGAMTYGDKGEVAGAVVLMLKGANASKVVKNVKEKIQQIRSTLPEGVILEPFYDRTKMVNRAIGTVQKNLLEGALIVVFVLVLFLGNIRAGLIVASVIPLSMLFAVIMMNSFGVSGNLMSLGALDFGLIVDGAVIIVEAVMHRLSHSKHLNKIIHITQGEMDNEVEVSSGKMMNSAVFGQVIILIVYLPILTLVGIEGKMFSPMAQTVSFALIGAFILSLTYVPMVSSLFLSKKIHHKENWSDRLMRFITKLYKPVLQKALSFPRTVIAIVLIIFSLSVFILTRLGGEFIPELEEGDFAVDARILTGSSLTESIKNSTKAAHILETRFPEVEKIVTRIGASEIPTDPMPVEMTDIIISLKPKNKWTSATGYDELANKMSEALKEIPGITTGFQFPVQMRFNELISGARQDVVCKIFGDDLDSLARYAQKLGLVINTVKGAKDVYIESVTGLPQVVITYNRDAMALYQLSVADVNQVIRTAFAGESAGMIYESERRYELVVRLQEELRKDLSDVQQLLIPSPTGLQIPLYQVADVRIKTGPNQIQREDARRRIIVGFNVRGRDVESVVKELEAKVDRGIRFQPGYYITYGGQFENLVEASKRLSIAVPAALMLILLMLYFAFGSFKYGVLIFSAIPLSAIGGVLALFLRGMPFSISAGVGFIALFGVAVLNGIVLIAEFNRMKKHGLHDLNKIIMDGTQVRLRPVMMTAAVASLGFLPMALSHGAGAEVQRPLATVVIGGLISATFLTLIVLPALYRWFENIRFKSRSKHVEITMLFLLVSLTGFAQKRSEKKIHLKEALQLAEKQNMELQTMRKEAAYWKEMQTGVFDPSKTQLSFEYGNINSFNNDTKFSLGQTFEMPSVYKRQKDLYKTREELQGNAVEMKSVAIKKQVTERFYNIVLLLERKKMIGFLDSVFSRFQAAATLRLKTGESNVLEKTTADAQLQQLHLQKRQLEADISTLQQQLSWLLHTDEILVPDYTDQKIKIGALDTAALFSHPILQYEFQKEKVAEAQWEVDKSKLAPDISLVYSNLSIVGYQSSDGITQKYYSGSNRFHTGTLTLGIPIFNKAAKARIKAASISMETAKLNASSTREYLLSRYYELQKQREKQNENLVYYEQTGLQHSELIIKNAALAFEEGEISYLDWVLLMNNAINIRLGYLQALEQYNQVAIEINYLISK